MHGQIQGGAVRVSGKSKDELQRVITRLREVGESSITVFWSVYYVVKVLLALLVGAFRKQIPLPSEADRRAAQ